MDLVQKEVVCTAVLIAKNIVMSAAHCFRSDSFEESRLFHKCNQYYGCSSVFVGHESPRYADNGEEIEIEDIYIHQNYIQNTTIFYHDDIALLKLARDVNIPQIANNQLLIFHRA